MRLRQNSTARKHIGCKKPIQLVHSGKNYHYKKAEHWLKWIRHNQTFSVMNSLKEPLIPTTIALIKLWSKLGLKP
jgi:hypothetical protein